jgi:ABC-type glutathione transport system ATPase component
MRVGFPQFRKPHGPAGGQAPAGRFDLRRFCRELLRQSAERATAKAREMLSIVGLLQKAQAYPRVLSGGEQQRVAIARAIVGDATAILADEPTGSLDCENGSTIMTILARIARDCARGVLVVTHDPRVVPFADRIIHMEDGRITGEENGKAADAASADRDLPGARLARLHRQRPGLADGGRAREPDAAGRGAMSAARPGVQSIDARQA